MNSASIIYLPRASYLPEATLAPTTPKTQSLTLRCLFFGKVSLYTSHVAYVYASVVDFARLRRIATQNMVSLFSAKKRTRSVVQRYTLQMFPARK